MSWSCVASLKHNNEFPHPQAQASTGKLLSCWDYSRFGQQWWKQKPVFPKNKFIWFSRYFFFLIFLPSGFYPLCFSPEKDYLILGNRILASYKDSKTYFMPKRRLVLDGIVRIILANNGVIVSKVEACLLGKPQYCSLLFVLSNCFLLTN